MRCFKRYQREWADEYSNRLLQLNEEKAYKRVTNAMAPLIVKRGHGQAIDSL
jgi:hypothetical protein